MKIRHFHFGTIVLILSIIAFACKSPGSSDKSSTATETTAVTETPEDIEAALVAKCIQDTYPKAANVCVYKDLKGKASKEFYSQWEKDPRPTKSRAYGYQFSSPGHKFPEADTLLNYIPFTNNLTVGTLQIGQQVCYQDFIVFTHNGATHYGLVNVILDNGDCKDKDGIPKPTSKTDPNPPPGGGVLSGPNFIQIPRMAFDSMKISGAHYEHFNTNEVPIILPLFKDSADNKIRFVKCDGKPGDEFTFDLVIYNGPKGEKLYGVATNIRL